MKKWTTVDQALTPDGKTISLNEHDGSYAIRVAGIPLMSTRQHASEEKLAELACARVREIRRARVLVGGLGFGFTLKAALAALAADATVVMAEILGSVIAWNRNPAFPLAAEALADPRVVVLQQDVGEVIREARGSFDSIILDVDNGPAATNYIVDGIEEFTAMNIISSQPEEIKNLLVNDLGKGITVYKGEKGYLPGSFEVKTSADIIVTIITRLEIKQIQDAVLGIDPKAFIYVQSIKEAAGGILKHKAHAK